MLSKCRRSLEEALSLVAWDGRLAGLPASRFSPPQPTLPTAARMSPRTDVRLPLPPAGLSPHALAWQNPNPDIASTYFLSHVVHCSPFTNLTHESNRANDLHQMHSVFSHHGACPHSVPSVSHSCMSRLYTPSEVWGGKCVSCACSDRLGCVAVLRRIL